MTAGRAVEAVVFDLDGVLIQSEEAWDAVREALTRERGGRWHGGAHRDMMGMSSVEWSAYMHHELGVADDPDWISDEVVRRLSERYRRELPLLPGAVAAVRRMAARWPLAVASSANGPLVELVLELAGVAALFAATVSSEEVARGKPAPDVYLEAAARLGADAERCAAVEDSHNGLLAARRAGMVVIAVPNGAFPPGAEALALADATLGSIAELAPDVVERAALSAP